MLLALALILSTSLNGIFGYIVFFASEKEYFATENGKVIPIIPTNEPYWTDGDVIEFAHAAVRNSFTLNFAQYKNQLENAQSYYSDKGFESFIGALQTSKILDRIKNDTFFLNVSAMHGTLEQEGEDSGTYVWIISFPIELKMSKEDAATIPQKQTVILRVERIPTHESSIGLAVTQIITKPR